MQLESLPTTRPLLTSWRRMFDRCSKLINQYTCWMQSETKKKTCKKSAPKHPTHLAIRFAKSGWEFPLMMTMSDVMGASIFSCFKILAGRKPPNLQTETPMNYGCWRAIWKNCEERLSCKRRTSTATTTTTREEEGTRDKFTNTWTNGWNSGCGRGGKKQDRGLRSVKSKKARLFWFPKKLARSIGSKIETQNGSRRKSESNKNMCVRELLISVQKHRTFAVFLWSLAWGSGSAISLNVSFGKGISSTVYVYLYNSISDSGTSGRRFHLTDLTHCRRSRAIWTTRTREKKMQLWNLWTRSKHDDDRWNVRLNQNDDQNDNTHAQRANFGEYFDRFNTLSTITRR